jgi:hypothetical protein
MSEGRRKHIKRGNECHSWLKIEHEKQYERNVKATDIRSKTGKNVPRKL